MIKINLIKRKFYLLLILLYMMSSFTQAEPELNNLVVTVSHTPDAPDPFGMLSIKITFTDVSDISNVRLTYCRIHPDYFCYFPLFSLNQTAEKEFTKEFELQDGEGSIIGYQFLITWINNSYSKYPNSLSTPFDIPIIEPVDNEFYFSITLGEIEKSSKLLNLPVGIFLVTIVILSLRKKLKLS
jgi:hypothetical protein